MDSGWEITTAARLDDLYRSDVARLTAPEPWFGEVAIRTERRTVLSRIGKLEDRMHQIVDWRHPYGRAFFELQPVTISPWRTSSAGKVDLRTFKGCVRTEPR